MKLYLKIIIYLKVNGYVIYYIKWCIFFIDICFIELDFFLFVIFI